MHPPTTTPHTTGTRQDPTTPRPPTPPPRSPHPADSVGSCIPEAYQAAIAQHWPGPLTILLPASPAIPAAVTAGQPTMAVRMPSHPVARALIAATGRPLAAPSANTSGRPSPTSAAHVAQDLAGAIPLVLDGGAAACGLESTVLDALRRPPVVLRPGGVTAEALAALPGLEGLQVRWQPGRASGRQGTGGGGGGGPAGAPGGGVPPGGGGSGRGGGAVRGHPLAPVPLATATPGSAAAG